MDSEIRDGIVRVEDRITRIEEELRESCRRGELNVRDLRIELAACLNGWLKNLVLGAAIVAGIAVIRR
jgi:hypothetical protein